MIGMSAIRLDYASIDDLVRGYALSDGSYACLYCGASFEDGRVFQIEGGLAVARRAAEDHVARAHDGPFAALTGSGAAGLPEAQERVLRLQYEGRTDAQIAADLGGKAVSTVRNHRLVLRRRESEARAYLALARLLEHRREARAGLIAYPAGLTVADERTRVTPDEAAAIESKYLRTGRDGAFSLASWPRKQKEKLVLLLRISSLFEPGRLYSEREVNAVLMPVWSDYVELRRYLIEYGFLTRKPDGSEYRLGS
jgi:hypothetical protein